jgi:hypothetical protein
VIKLINKKLTEKLLLRKSSVTLEHILDNSKAGSGGQRDVNFISYLIDNSLLNLEEAVLKRSEMDLPEEYYLQNYKKKINETSRHFLCRAIIQDELKKIGIESSSEIGLGNMELLRANSNYDIVTDDFTTAIDIGLSPARNYFRCLTDLRVTHYFLTAFFDDYIQDIVFSVFTRAANEEFIQAVKDYMERPTANPILASSPTEAAAEEQV